MLLLHRSSQLLLQHQFRLQRSLKVEPDAAILPEGVDVAVPLEVPEALVEAAQVAVEEVLVVAAVAIVSESNRSSIARSSISDVLPV
jgi:hypothetical protein